MEEYRKIRATEGESIYLLNLVCVCMCKCVYLNYLRNHKITHIHEVGSEINIIRITKEHNFSFCISDCLILIDLCSKSTAITNMEILHFQNYQCVVATSLIFQQFNGQLSNYFSYEIPTTTTFVVIIIWYHTVFANIRAKQNSHVARCNMHHTIQILVEGILSIFNTCVIVSNWKI